MRAGRLVNLMLILHHGGRITAAELAKRLEVSERTVLRDIEVLSAVGVPVYATRGRGGGFQLLDGYAPPTRSLGDWNTRDRPPGRPQRATVLISPEGRRLAALLGRLQPLHISADVPADERGWCPATFPVGSFDGSVVDVLSLGPHIEVIAPAELRNAVADQASRTALLYRQRSMG